MKTNVLQLALEKDHDPHYLEEVQKQSYRVIDTLIRTNKTAMAQNEELKRELGMMRQEIEKQARSTDNLYQIISEFMEEQRLKTNKQQSKK